MCFVLFLFITCFEWNFTVATAAAIAAAAAVAAAAAPEAGAAAQG